MSVQHQISVLTRVKKIVETLETKYKHRQEPSHELKKLHAALMHLLDYLNKLDQLKPNYNTNEINEFVEAVTVNLVILKAELEKKDYERLAKAIKGSKTLLQFHASKWSFFEFLIAWFVEFFYFI